MTKDKKYNWSDAWLLLTITYASSGSSEATLEKIISIGDAINHAIFNADELESGFARLTSGGYIKEKNKTFFIASKVKRAYLESTSRGRTVSKELYDIEQLIGAAPAISEQPQINDLKYAGFSQEAFREAVDKYLIY